MKKIIVLGMNRTGTKLASYLIAKSFNLQHVYLEPFTWDKGIDSSLSDNWQPQQQLRKKDLVAQKEHARLKIISDKNETSEWLRQLLNETPWDIIKFVEIGRHDLYQKYNEDAFYVSLIREPHEYLQSINGMTPARQAVVEQWQRLHNVEGYNDPLPDANLYLDQELADCARAYFILYNQLRTFSPKNGIKINYNLLKSTPSPLLPIATYLNATMEIPSTIPLQGASTKSILQVSEIDYLNLNLNPIYDSFLHSDC